MGSRGGCDWEISELQYLFTWKKRLVVSSFSLSDCDNLLKLINCSNNWESSIVQRSRFFVIEKVVVSFWDSTNFGREFLEASSFVFLHQIAHNFLQIVDHIETNNENVWFGGIVPGNERSAFFSIRSITICIHLSGLLYLNDSAIVTLLLKKLNRFGECANTIASSLLENDERCLSTLSALLYLHENSVVLPDELNPRYIFVCVMYQIGFDHEVLVEWIHSEIISSICLYRFFKDIKLNLMEYNSNLKKQFHCGPFAETKLYRHKRPKKNTSSFEVRDSLNAGFLLLNIQQIHGNQPEITTFHFPYKQEITVIKQSDGCNGSLNKENLMQNMIDCFIRFRLVCERMKVANIEPFNLKFLIKAIEGVEETWEYCIMNGIIN